MAKVVLRQKAIDDLTGIWNYTFSKWSENQANTYYNSIKNACLIIGENPNIGKRYSKINKEMLGLKSGRHIIFYRRVSKDEIEVLRILHEKMDLKNRISE